jgi:hypothetical protein
MNYLGGMTGYGVMRCAGIDVARASFDLEGYLRPRVGVTGCGEIAAPTLALLAIVGRTDVQLLTDEGLVLDIQLSGGPIMSDADVAHVDVTGGLPDRAADWPR